jgi:hypothetical protein
MAPAFETVIVDESEPFGRFHGIKMLFEPRRTVNDESDEIDDNAGEIPNAIDSPKHSNKPGFIFKLNFKDRHINNN